MVVDLKQSRLGADQPPEAFEVGAAETNLGQAAASETAVADVLAGGEGRDLVPPHLQDELGDRFVDVCADATVGDPAGRVMLRRRDGHQRIGPPRPAFASAWRNASPTVIVRGRRGAVAMPGRRGGRGAVCSTCSRRVRSLRASFELTVEHVLERLRLLEAAADVGAQAEADDVRGALPGLALLGAHSKLDVPVLHAGSVPSTAVGSSKPPWRDPGPKDLQGRGLSRVAFGGALSERAPGRGSLVDAPP